MGQQDIRRPGAAVWPALCATHLLRSRRCPFMDDEAERHVVGNTLHILTMGAPLSKECDKNMKIMTTTCEWAGLPVAPSKSVGPATSLTFLGIEMDSIDNSLRLPSEKLAEIREQLSRWRGFKACKKRDLLSLIGSLSYASKVVRPGRAFLRRRSCRS